VNRAPEELLGTWEVVHWQAGGQEMPREESGQMRLVFSEAKATWQFKMREGWKAEEGSLRVDLNCQPKEIDLGQPVKGKAVALGIYRIEGNQLTISMDAKRPKDFQQQSLFKLVLVRLGDTPRE
jgi:uncharacterized protein (TIGR03067 family)